MSISFRKVLGLGLLGVMLAAAVPTFARRKARKKVRKKAAKKAVARLAKRAEAAVFAVSRRRESSSLRPLSRNFVNANIAEHDDGKLIVHL